MTYLCTRWATSAYHPTPTYRQVYRAARVSYRGNYYHTQNNNLPRAELRRRRIVYHSREL
jgi:hypothetical protein